MILNPAAAVMWAVFTKVSPRNWVEGRGGIAVWEEICYVIMSSVHLFSGSFWVGILTNEKGAI